MGCCESRHDASQFTGFNNRPHNFDPTLGKCRNWPLCMLRTHYNTLCLDYACKIASSGAEGALEAVSRAAEAIKSACVRSPEPSALRDMRLALLSLPREASNVPEVPEVHISITLFLCQKDHWTNIHTPSMNVCHIMTQKYRKTGCMRHCNHVSCFFLS
jgi:hypothetical protein